MGAAARIFASIVNGICLEHAQLFFMVIQLKPIEENL